MNRTKLSNILKALSPDKTVVDFAPFDNEVQKLKDKLTEQVVVKTLEDVNVQLEKNRKQIDFKPLLAEFENLKQDVAEKHQVVLDTVSEKQKELATLVNSTVGDNSERISELEAELALLSAKQIPDFGKQIQQAEQKLTKLVESVKAADEADDKAANEAVQMQFVNFEKEMKKLRVEMVSRGGGSMNRQMLFNSTNRLTKYTDINWKAGSNVTFTIANNNQTKQVDVTVSATGGGGGSTRVISTITVDTAADATAADYVYLCNGTLTLTLPDAAANTNLYTVKNIGSGIVTIATTSAQTIDGSTTITMPTQYTSIDAVSDTANWSIT